MLKNLKKLLLPATPRAYTSTNLFVSLNKVFQSIPRPLSAPLAEEVEACFWAAGYVIGICARQYPPDFLDMYVVNCTWCRSQWAINGRTPSTGKLPRSFSEASEAAKTLGWRHVGMLWQCPYCRPKRSK